MKILFIVAEIKALAFSLRAENIKRVGAGAGVTPQPKQEQKQDQKQEHKG